MQVARNFFLTREKTYARKINEILLALKIERELDKPAILELYLNKIYLGHRAYGVGAAAQVYYGKTLEQLTLPQIAMIAGLPKAPSKLNPVTNPGRATSRRNYVLGRMYEQGVIGRAEHDAAVAEPITASLHGLEVELEAPFVAEMVRAEMVERFGDDAYTSGFEVYTTISTRMQRAARDAVRSNLVSYDERHGYRGPEHHYDLAGTIDDARASELLESFAVIGDMQPALVLAVDEEHADLALANGNSVRLGLDAMRWARAYKTANWRGPRPAKPAEVLAVGDVVRLRQVPVEPAEGEKEARVGPPALTWSLAQIPDAEGALVALDPRDGAMRAMVGGFDFAQSKFNRVTQAKRQPGSNFKPFIYSAALEAGYTAASFVNDAPIVFDAPGLESVWRPENYSGKYYGPTRLREALSKSRNLVSIRLLREMGIETALEHAQRFGFNPAELPQNLSLSLGSGELTPLQVASAYAVLANGGYRVEPYIIERIRTDKGEVVMQAEAPSVCYLCEVREFDPDAEPDSIEALQAVSDDSRNAPRVIAADNAWIMGSMMRDVIRRGTGRRALALGRSDLAGKTGTTNDQKDAWFSGFNASLVATVWVGFDQVRTLGRNETGAKAALPVWVDFMRVALDGVPESVVDRPAGLVTMSIDPTTGAPARAGDPNAIFETFRRQYVPEGPRGGGPSPFEQPIMPEQLF